MLSILAGWLSALAVVLSTLAAVLKKRRLPNRLFRPWLRLLAAALMLSLGACDSGQQTSQAAQGKSAKAVFHHTDITGSSLQPILNLPDGGSGLRQIADFRGKILLIFFGFTQCPDVCPTTLQEAAEAIKLLSAEQAARVQVIFVTLDPDRDRPELLDAYVKAFHPNFVWLRGDEEQTRAAAKSFRVFYDKVASKSGGPYSIDHTAASFVF
ncbi:MAG: SCO family protein, partial [Betaproteobacteria bacterium]|nr:SCO family protein [Betaproteobacteria bacterium]